MSSTIQRHATSFLVIFRQVFPGLILSDIKPAKRMKFKTVCYLLVQLMHCRKMFKAEIPFSNVMTCEDDDKRRALRTASEKLRNRSSFSTNVIHNTPGTRVNRYISRLIEARQTDSEMSDLNFLSLKYRQIEREQKAPAATTGCDAQYGVSYPRGKRDRVEGGASYRSLEGGHRRNSTLPVRGNPDH
ncbi:adenylate cyclase type 1 [Pelobates cultripes]|uniref:Adenylate cyclase type 1, partial n=1 Tax=Pelobates cultripes TaxID=61616 RepID=A0AAD1RXJ4_PELCU|nr:adenylate cyclase type 1 [Pelobates cultripes]